jgi:DNA polymerase
MLGQHLESYRLAGVEWIPRPVAGGTVPLGFDIQAARKNPASTRPLASEDRLVAVPSASAPPVVQPLSTPSTRSTKDKRIALQLLNEQNVVGCTRCPELAGKRTQTVFGTGDPDCELLFVGEAPGADEDEKGEPFVGAAGQLLTKIIEACKLKRSEVYICNVLKCRPPGNRVPEPVEVANCWGFLEQQIDIVRPKFICCLGATASKTMLKTDLAIGKLRGKFHDYQGIPLLCTYHPSYLLRNPSAKKDVWEDMKKLMTKMGRPVE